MIEPRLVGVKEAAKFLGISVGTVGHLTDEGRLIAIYIGQSGSKKPSKLYDIEDLRRFVELQKPGAALAAELAERGLYMDEEGNVYPDCWDCEGTDDG